MKLKPCFAVLALGGLAACASDAPESSNLFPEDHIIRVTTNINEVVETRSASDYTGDNFALYIAPAGDAKEAAYTYENVSFTKNGSEWTPSDGSELRWKSKSTTYNYFAYAPASGESGTALEDNFLPYDLSTDNIDLLWTGVSGKTAQQLAGETGAIQLVFDHMFCKFFVQLTVGTAFYGDSQEENPVQLVSFSNATGKGMFDVTTGNISDGTSSVEITASEGTHEAGTETTEGVYTTGGDYMAPGEQAVTVHIIIDGNAYTYTHEAYTFEAGKSYTLKIIAGPSRVMLQGITVNSWTNGDDATTSTF